MKKQDGSWRGGQDPERVCSFGWLVGWLVRLSLVVVDKNSMSVA